MTITEDKPSTLTENIPDNAIIAYQESDHYRLGIVIGETSEDVVVAYRNIGSSVSRNRTVSRNKVILLWPNLDAIPQDFIYVDHNGTVTGRWELLNGHVGAIPATDIESARFTSRRIENVAVERLSDRDAFRREVWLKASHEAINRSWCEEINEFMGHLNLPRVQQQRDEHNLEITFTGKMQFNRRQDQIARIIDRLSANASDYMRTIYSRELATNSEITIEGYTISGTELFDPFLTTLEEYSARLDLLKPEE